MLSNSSSFVVTDLGKQSQLKQLQKQVSQIQKAVSIGKKKKASG
jgi:hypothetical protein